MTAEVNFTWNGGEADAQLRQKALEGIQRATVMFHTELLKVLNVSNPRPYKTPSQPGEAPRKRTGFGQANVVYEIDPVKLQGRVGVRKNAFYLMILEIFRNRPWFMATLKRMKSQLAAVLKIK